MKNPEKFKEGVYPTWYHLLNGTPVYCLPDFGNDGVKFAIHEHDSEIEKKFKTEEEFIEAKMQQVHSYIEHYFKGEYESVKKVEKCYYTATNSYDFLIDWTDSN